MDYKVRYRPELELVLDGINCDIKGTEKVRYRGKRHQWSFQGFNENEYGPGERRVKSNGDKMGKGFAFLHSIY